MSIGNYLLTHDGILYYFKRNGAHVSLEAIVKQLVLSIILSVNTQA